MYFVASALDVLMLAMQMVPRHFLLRDLAGLLGICLIGLRGIGGLKRAL